MKLLIECKIYKKIGLTDVKGRAEALPFLYK